MELKRLAGTFAAASIAATGLVAVSATIATPASASTCIYKVNGSKYSFGFRKLAPVHKRATSNSAEIGYLYKGGWTVGKCRSYNSNHNWRKVKSHFKKNQGNDRTGFAHKKYLDKRVPKSWSN